MEHYKVQRMTNMDRINTPLICDRVGKYIGHISAVDRLTLTLNKYVRGRNLNQPRLGNVMWLSVYI